MRTIDELPSLGKQDIKRLDELEQHCLERVEQIYRIPL